MLVAYESGRREPIRRGKECRFQKVFSDAHAPTCAPRASTCNRSDNQWSLRVRFRSRSRRCFRPWPGKTARRGVFRILGRSLSQPTVSLQGNLMQRVKTAAARGFRKPSVFEAKRARKPRRQVLLGDVSSHVRLPRSQVQEGGGSTKRTRNYFSELGSERSLGDFLLSNETIFCAEGGTGTAPSRTIAVALTFFP